MSITLCKFLNTVVKLAVQASTTAQRLHGKGRTPHPYLHDANQSYLVSLLGSTGANADSSRSHAILQVLLKPKKNRKQITGKLSFIDLAGSERGADRGDADTKTRYGNKKLQKKIMPSMMDVDSLPTTVFMLT